MFPRLHTPIRLRSQINPIHQARHKHRSNRHHDARILNHTRKPASIALRCQHGLGAGEGGGEDGGENGLHGEVDGEGGGLESRELGAWEDFEGDYAGDEGLGVLVSGYSGRGVNEAADLEDGRAEECAVAEYVPGREVGEC